MELKELDFYVGNRDLPLVLCLGFFDSLHKGHVRLFARAQQIAAENGWTRAVFTFKENIYAMLGHDVKEVFIYPERKLRLSELGIDTLLALRPESAFLETDGETFLQQLVDRFDIRAVVAGADYTFGKDAACGVEKLISFCQAHGIQCSIEGILSESGEKVSSTRIRRLLKAGQIEEVNHMLPLPYFMIGTVVKGRSDGRLIGFPTANIALHPDKLAPLAGVYFTRVWVDGARHFAITNIGTHPTFEDELFNIESFLLDFEGSLYGKEIKVEFLEYIRGIAKFENAAKLSEQLQKDTALAFEKRSQYD